MRSVLLYQECKNPPAQTRLLLMPSLTLNMQAPCARAGEVCEKNTGIMGLVIKLDAFAC